MKKKKSCEIINFFLKKKTVNIITIIAFSLIQVFYFPLVIKPSDPPPPLPPLLSLSYILSPLYPSLISYYNYMNVKMKSNPNFQILKRKPHKANHKAELTKFQTVPAHSDFVKSYPHSHAHHNTYNTIQIL